ncbi:MAG TPA: RagB/SusD family nutrient uptake outer membrane protein [Flavisolibacter sp.]|nr:RagB/SusD family nutrient uptake outer membrane protein [Flavisolibacter sp.]
MKYRLLPVIIGLATLSSCKKEFLELNPPTSLTPSQALGSEGDLQVALRGVYSGLRNVDYYGRTFPILGDILSDNTYQSSQNTNRYTLFNNYSFNVTDGNVAGLWNAAYTVILRANNIINSELTASPGVNQYKGEAYALRALAYFDLVRYFARPYNDNPSALGVPIVTTYNPDLKPARNTVQEVYNQIKSDLTQAYSLMTQFTNSSQFSKYAARALEAKVLLTMGDYANAKTAALDVINNGGFSVVPAASYVSYWTNPAIETSKGETLLEVSSDAVNNLAFDALGYLYSQGGNYGDLLVSEELYALMETGDVRRNLYPTGNRPAGVPAIFVEKYPSIVGDRDDTKVLRMSEVYLIAAEASYRTGSEPDALMYLNYIRTRRNATPSTATGAALLDDIIEERRIELAFEGDRYHDLQRLMLPVSRSANYPSSARTIEYSNFRRVLPIPQGEIDANPNIRTQQNPGY